MRSANPAYIPRNHRVEQALRAAEEGNLQPFDHLLRVVRKPYDEQLENLGYQTPPKPEEEVRQTFCGT